MPKTLEEPQAHVVASMKRLGLSDYESRIYVALIQSSPATAYELSKISGVPRPNAYSALEALAARGAVMPVSAKPVRYVPQPPKEFFGRVVSQTRDVCEELTTALDVIAAPQAENYVWNLSGDAEVDGKVAEMIEAATSTIWIKGDAGLMERQFGRLETAALEKDVGIKVILFGDNPERYRFTERCEIYVHEASGVRMGTADNLFTIVTDHLEMLTANDDGLIRAAHTQNQAIVKMALSLIRHDYYMAEIFQKYKAELDATFGPHLQALREKSYTGDQLQSFYQKTGVDEGG